mmetsp:Transcript_140919/g.270404  ORF Transcript_140919/g.270404 Transcript_140919/m.270404 type:complete len:105 (-) Transcript_140919:2-316(-)
MLLLLQHSCRKWIAPSRLRMRVAMAFAFVSCCHICEQFETGLALNWSGNSEKLARAVRLDERVLHLHLAAAWRAVHRCPSAASQPAPCTSFKSIDPHASILQDS